MSFLILDTTRSSSVLALFCSVLASFVFDQAINMPKFDHNAFNLFGLSANCFTIAQIKDSCLVNGQRDILTVADYWATLDHTGKPALVSTLFGLLLVNVCASH